MKTLLFAVMMMVTLPNFAFERDNILGRSQAEKRRFAKVEPCPSSGLPSVHCPDFVIDHVTPLCAGGEDRAENMQWQNLYWSRAKDRIEWEYCRCLRAGDNCPTVVWRRDKKEAQ